MARQAIWEYFKASLIALSLVDKDRAEEFVISRLRGNLKSYGARFGGEVKPGLTEEPAPQKRLPLASLITAIKTEAQRHGLDQKYYVSSDRTIRN